MRSLLPITKYDLRHLLMQQDMFPYTLDYALQDGNNDFLKC
jgi:hypothetical protein